MDMNTFRRGVLLCLLLTATAGCDRVTKHYAMTTLAGEPAQSFLGDTVRLDYHENPGGFLSAGASWNPTTRAVVFQLANGAFLLVALFMAYRHKWSRLATIGLMMFVAGGLSNLIDRVAIGTVIDFLSLGYGPFRTGIFNVADVAIMTGAILLLADHSLSRRSAPARRRTAV
jgi:signal peptidase II